MINTVDDGRFRLWADPAKGVVVASQAVGIRSKGAVLLFRLCVSPILEGGLGKMASAAWRRSVRGRQMHGEDCGGARQIVEGKCGQKRLKTALEQLARLDGQVDSAVYASLLRSCGNAKYLRGGRRVHSHIIRAGCDGRRFLGNLLVQMYGNCGCPEDARHVFDNIRQPNIFSWNIMVRVYAMNGRVEDARCLFIRMPQRDVVSWTAMIAAYAQNGHCKAALGLFRQMQLTRVAPDKITFISILDACASLTALAEGRDIHARIIDNGFETDAVAGTSLINMYGKCGSLDSARSVFDKLCKRDVVSWTAMIATYARNGHGKEALELFRQMQLGGIGADKVTFIGVLDACSSLAALAEGKESHAAIIHSGFQTDAVVANALVNMYGKCGSLDDARSVFDKIAQRDIVSWTAMIGAFSQNERGKEALEVFEQMQLKGVVPDKITFISILDACSGMASLTEGKESHAGIIDSSLETDTLVGTALVNMYGKWGNLEDARSVFDRMRQRDVVSWTAMIAAYVQNGHHKYAFKLFQQMQITGVVPDKIAFINILDACSDLGALALGKNSHATIIYYGFEKDAVVGNALVNMYGKCGSLDDARSAFDKIPERSIASWNAMIATYAQHDHGKVALKLFQQMLLTGLMPDKITFISILDACSGLAALAEGKETHARIIDSGFEMDAVVGNALVNMYGKCGSLDDARSTFNKLPQHNVVSWNAIIGAFAQNGHGKEALKLFQQMQLTGVVPNKITFINILSGCSHAGLLEDGWHYFVSMNRDYAITPAMEHFVCMIDLLGRSGQFDEAEDMVNSMPFEPYATAWMSFLGACRIHGNVEQGVRTAEYIIELDPNNASPFVLLSNIYAAAGEWKNATKVRKVMKDRGVMKKPGCSYIEVKKKVHEFVVGDTSHAQKEDIYLELQRLNRHVEVAGYMPDTKVVLHDVEEVKKEHMLFCHSEKLAIAFGLISTLPGTPLHITKNLRVCSDCHTVIKLISKIVMRKIVVRDANRYHHFEHGLCSCQDYW